MRFPRSLSCFALMAAFAWLGVDDRDRSFVPEEGLNSEKATSSNRVSPRVTSSPVAYLQTTASKAPTEEEEVQHISFEDLEFELEPEDPFQRDLLTSEIEALDGKRIRLRGFMLPSYKADGIEEFVLVRDNQICCFGPGARIYHNSMVAMAPGRSTSFTTRVVVVDGTFHIDEYALDGVVYSCFRIVATSVRAL